MSINPTCEDTGKVSYRSVHHARLANKQNGKTLRVYSCGNHFHVTSQRKKIA